jgi:hypothetical protein
MESTSYVISNPIVSHLMRPYPEIEPHFSHDGVPLGLSYQNNQRLKKNNVSKTIKLLEYMNLPVRQYQISLALLRILPANIQLKL